MKPKQIRFDWHGTGALKDLLDHVSTGGSYREFLTKLRDKYGVCVTVARLSQLKKKYFQKETV